MKKGTCKIVGILILTVVCLNSSPLFTQLSKLGLSGGTGYKFVSYSFNKLPDVARPDIPLTYQKGSLPYELNIFAEYNIYKDLFAGVQGGYIVSSFNFIDKENITVIVNKVPVEATIEHKMNLRMSWLYPAVYFGYNFWKELDFSAGSKFMFPFRKNYSQTQELILPGSVSIINPALNHSGKITYSNKPYIMPFVRASYNSPKLQFKNIRLVPELEYAFGINNIIKDLDFRYSSLSAKIQLAVIPVKRNVVFRFDTAYTRDTVVNLSYKGDSQITRLISAEPKTTETGRDTVLYSTNITEIYETLILKPKSILNCELKAVFISENEKETNKLRISYNKEIRRLLIFNGSGSQFREINDTINDLHLPAMKILPSAISEAGLMSWKFEISSDNNVIFKKSGTGNPPESLIVDLDNLIPNKENFSGVYTFSLTDNDEQTAVCSEGVIKSKEKPKKYKESNSTFILIPMNRFDDSFFTSSVKNLSKKGVKAQKFYLVTNNLDQTNIEKITFPKLKKALSENEYKILAGLYGENLTDIIIILAEN